MNAANCDTENPAIPELLLICGSLLFGGFGLTLWVDEHVNENRRILRSLLIGFALSCCGFSVLFLFMTGLHPHTWGLPPEWLPAKLNPCLENYRDYFPHGAYLLRHGLAAATRRVHYSNVVINWGDGTCDAEHLQYILSFPPFGLAVTILGFVIFAYGYWEARVGFDFNRNRPDWMASAILAFGIIVFVFGLCLTCDGSQVVANCPEQSLQFKVSHRHE